MKKNILALSLILVFFLALSIFSQTQVLPQSQESISVTTYYPAPYGVYKQMEAESLGVGDTNNDGTINGADVPADPGDCWVAGDVGIGTRSPAAKLDVAGGVKIDDDTSACSAMKAGTLRYSGGNIQYCHANQWQTVSGNPFRHQHCGETAWFHREARINYPGQPEAWSPRFVPEGCYIYGIDYLATTGGADGRVKYYYCCPFLESTPDDYWEDLP